MSEEKKYLLTTGQLGKVMAYVLASNQGVEEAELLANFILNSNEYHERTCTMLHGTAVGLDCYKCDECDNVSYTTHAPNYCPNCGAKVVEE